MSNSINIDGVVNEILRLENATMDDVDQDALEVFKIHCDYIDIICGHHTQGDKIEVDFDLNDDKDIVVRMRFTGKPPMHLTSYQLLRIGALEDRIISNSKNQYLLVFVLGSFIKYED